MAVTRNKLYIESDNLWRVDSLIDKTDDSAITDATIIASVCKDVALAVEQAPSDEGGGEVGFKVTAHGLTTGDYIRIVGSINYDQEIDVTVTDADNFTITDTYVAEAVFSTIDIFVVVPNAYQISIPHIATGNYRGVLPDTMHLINELWYRVFTDVNASGTRLLMQDRLQAVYF